MRRGEESKSNTQIAYLICRKKKLQLLTLSPGMSLDGLLHADCVHLLGPLLANSKAHFDVGLQYILRFRQFVSLHNTIFFLLQEKKAK